MLWIGHRLEDLVLDADLLGRTPRLLGMLSRDQRDRLAPIADEIEGEDRLVGDLEAIDLLTGNVLVREHHDHAGCGTGGGRIDRDDARIWVRAAHGRAPKHAVDLEVRRVGEVASHLEHAVGPADVLPDAAVDRGMRREARLRRDHRDIRPEARWTASMIFA